MEEMGRGFRPMNQKKNMVVEEMVLNGGGTTTTRTMECKFVIKLPHSRVLRVISRSLLLAIAIFTLPWVGSQIMGSSSKFYTTTTSTTTVVVSEPMNGEILPILINDLINEGLLKKGDKSLLFISDEAISFNEVASSFKNDLHFLNDNEMSLISGTDIERQNSIPQESLDFVLVSGFGTVTFLDRILKKGGIAVVQLNDAFRKPDNYRIEYVRRFDSTIVALRKTGSSDLSTKKRPTSRRLYGFQFDLEAKKEALKGLEDVLLEPPRASSMVNFSKRTKFLPSLIGDSLKGYSRRVFVDVGSAGGAEWFEKYYPTNNNEFEMYRLEFESEKLSGKAMEEHQIGVSDWLNKNVKEEEYVVMKAESEVVEEMMKNKAISLVDELFLECDNQWQGEKPQQHQQQQQQKKRTRAYWECLALYGRLRDEGVAVHQWWG